MQARSIVFERGRRLSRELYKQKNIYIYKIKIKKTKEKKRNTHTHNSAKLQNSNPLRRRRGEKTTARAVDFPACVASHSFIHSFIFSPPIRGS